MRTVYLATLVAFHGSAFAQSSITRTCTETSVKSSFTVAAPGITDAWSSFTGPRATATSDLADVPPLAGVELVSIGTTSSLQLDIAATLVGLVPQGTTVRANYLAGYSACGGFCTWGPSDPFPLGGSFDLTVAPIGSGQLVSVSQRILDMSPGGGYSTLSNDWPVILAGPSYGVSCGLDQLSIWGVDPSNESVDFECGSLTLSAVARLDFTIDVGLTETAFLQTCTSQANSTGVTGSLRAYGSRVSGTEWLTVRASQLPPNQASLLFMGTEPAFIPGATYDICVGGALTREGGVQITNAAGESDHQVSLKGRPAGSSLYVQVVHRDPVLGVAATGAAAFFVE